MAEIEPSAPTPPEPAAAPAAGDEGTTPAPKPPEGEGAEPAAPAAGDGGDEPAKPADGAEGDEPAPAEGDGDGDGDKPADDPEKPAEGGEPDNQAPDLKTMSRAERAQYFQNLENQTRQEVEAKVAEVYQPNSIDELKQKYIDEGYSDFEARSLARDEMRDQEADIAKAGAERAKLNASLAIESTEVLNTIDWLNPNNKEAYDKKSSDAAIELYDVLCLTRDPNVPEVDGKGEPIPGSGQIIGATMTPKQFYGLMDTIRSSGTETARIAAQKAAEEQMASVAAPASNSNKRVDKAFDQLSNAEKRKQLQDKGILIT